MGLSLATLLSRNHQVIAIDIVKEKIDMVNSRKSPIHDPEIEDHMKNYDLDLTASSDMKRCAGADYVIIATPTNYDSVANKFDMSIVNSTVEKVSEITPQSTIVIKSTVPIGYTKELYDRGFHNVVFSPEFLREGRALYDNLHPSRIIVGVPSKNNLLLQRGEVFLNLLKNCSLEAEKVNGIITGSTEAEAIKLFSNSYLAMRVSFFNELDSFAEVNGLDSKEIIQGVSMDPRIGDYYNNPSFGYGGYCLPKDTKELLINYRNTPNEIIRAIVKSNDTRKDFIKGRILDRINGTAGPVGIYKLGMKSGSDNHRDSSILSIIGSLIEDGIEILIYDPSLNGDRFNECTVVKTVEELKERSRIIVANRIDDSIQDVSEKIYTRDVLQRD